MNSSSATSSLSSSRPVSRADSPFSSANSTNRQQRIKIEQIESSLTDHRQVRNVCILAHVDHGKTTLTDTMLASNGIISFKQAGNLRYMDSRDDEQERGITMQSSSITLLFDKATTGDEHKRYAINIIDSPGHVDFSRQVVTATRICDGCLLLVDAVEGVCIQTLSVLRQARKSGLTPILVINKMDRLINELHLSTQDATLWLERLIEAVNAAQASLFGGGGSCDSDYGIDGNMDHNVSEMVSFDPLIGNVVFSSATDGWAFTPLQFIPFLKEKYPTISLEDKMWGPYVLNTRTKEIRKEQGKKNIFSLLILDSIWSIYKSAGLLGDAEFEAEKLERYSSLLKIATPLPTREMKQKDGRAVMRHILAKWIPLSFSIMSTIIQHVPDPLIAGRKVLRNLLKQEYSGAEGAGSTATANATATSIRNHLLNPVCTGVDHESLVVAFISKMISVPRKQCYGIPLSSLSLNDSCSEDCRNGDDCDGSCLTTTTTKEEKLLGMTRIFHGNLKVGQDVFIVSEGKKSIPTRIGELYIMMGRDLEAVDQVPYGTVCVVGLEKDGISTLIRGSKTATISSVSECPPITLDGLEAMQPIVQVAVRTKSLEDMPALIKGLTRLCQADPCAESWVQEENGEYVLACAGELHLEQCLKDLKERYVVITQKNKGCIGEEEEVDAEVEIITSPIMVPYRETINDTATMAIKAKFWREKTTPNIQLSNPAVGKFTVTSGASLTFTLRATKVPEVLLSFLKKNHKHLIDSLEVMDGRGGGSGSDCTVYKELSSLLEDLPSSSYDIEPLRSAKNIWSIGPRKEPSNILLCTCANANIQSASAPFFKADSKLEPYESCILAAFQLSVEKGPMANEECKGICYVIEDIVVNGDGFNGACDSGSYGDNVNNVNSGASYSNSSNSNNNNNNNLLSTSRAAFHAAMLYWSPRLQLAMYNCTILTSAEQLGRVYACLTKRHARIVDEEFQDGTGFFAIRSLLPVVESFGFSEELRSKTGGVAMPQFTYTGVFDDSLDEDPYEQLLIQQNPSEAESSPSMLSTASTAMSTSTSTTSTSFRALDYMNEIRDRKGLIVERKLVQHAEKQRTLRR